VNGPEHYAAAEQLLRSFGPLTVKQAHRAAQVHATLALAAATGLAAPDNDAWQDVAGDPS
jgi:hypothetical protein